MFTYEGKSDALEWWDPLDKTQSTMFKKAADLQEWIRLEERKAKKKLVQTVNVRKAKVYAHLRAF